MAQPMAFRAAYSDWRLIKTRGVVQVVLEVPLADADAAYNVLGGMPDASRENWFAVAPLKLPPAEKESLTELIPAAPQPTTHPPAAAKRAKRDWRDIPPTEQAGIRCDDAVFEAFLREQYADDWEACEYDAAEVVRFLCGVNSRSLLGDNHAARMIWKQLDDQFQAWQRVGA